MPRTRRQIGRDEKVEEILAAAERQVRAGGFAGLSVAAIARELGLAQNAVYWYFPSKDGLFVAVLRRILGRVTEKEGGHRGTLEQIMLTVDQIAPLQPLRAAVRERAQASEVVARFEQELGALLHDRLAEALRQWVPEDELDLATRTFLATVQGTYALGLKPRERRRTLSFALERLTAGRGRQTQSAG